jgi:hypothetical protein
MAAEVAHDLAEAGTHMGAAVGDYKADSLRYSKINADMKAAYHAAFYRTDTGSYAAPGQLCSQTADALAVVLGVVPAAEMPRVWQSLNRSLYCVVGSEEPSIVAGSVGTRFVLEALTLLGQEAVAVRIATKETMPSFGWMVDQGPGTLWEQWNGDMYHPGGDPTRGGAVSSKNHHMYGGGVGLFLMERVAGISTMRIAATAGSTDDESAALVRVVVVKPLLRIMQQIRAATASVHAPVADHSSRAHKTVKVSWAYFDQVTHDETTTDAANIGAKVSAALSALQIDGDSHLGMQLAWQVNVTVAASAGAGANASVPVTVHIPLGGSASGACATAILQHDMSVEGAGGSTERLLWAQGSDAMLKPPIAIDAAGRNEMQVQLDSQQSEQTLSFSVLATPC